MPFVGAATGTLVAAVIAIYVRMIGFAGPGRQRVLGVSFLAACADVMPDLALIFVAALTALAIRHRVRRRHRPAGASR